MSEAQQNAPIENATEIIERFGGIRPMAKKMDVAVTTVQGWKKREVIPGARRAEVLSAAAAHDVDLAGLMEDAPAVANDAARSLTPESGAVRDETVIADKGSSAPAAPETVEEEAAAPIKPSTSTTRAGTEERSAHGASDAELEAAKQQRLSNTALVSIILGALALIAVIAILWPQPEPAREVFPDDERLSALEADIERMQSDVEAVQDRQSFFGAMIPDNLDEEINNLKEKAGAARENLDQALVKAKEVSDDVLSRDAGTMDERMAKLGAHYDEIVHSPEIAEFIEKMSAMGRDMTGKLQLDQAMEEMAALMDVAEDQARVRIERSTMEGGIASELAELSGDTPETDVSASAQDDVEQDTMFTSLLAEARERSPALNETFEGVPPTDLKAAALLMGMSQFRAALNRDNEAFESDLKVLRGLVGEDNPELDEALLRLAPHAKEGVLTLSGLSGEFRTIAGDAVVASLSGDDVSIKERTSARMNQLFSVEKDGELVTGTDTQATLARAEKLLQGGDIEGALEQTQSLEGAAAEAMQPWVDKARATLQARKIDAMLEEQLFAPDGAGLSERMLHDPQSGVRVLRPSSRPRNPAPGIGDANPYD